MQEYHLALQNKICMRYSFVLTVIVLLLPFASNNLHVKSAASKPQYTVIDLGTLGGSVTAVSAMNDKGQIVGNSETAHQSIDAYLWQHGQMVDVGVLPRSVDSSATSINNYGQVVGVCSFVNTDQSSPLPISHAFLWQSGQMIDLGSLGGSLTMASHINDSGQIVGMASTTGEKRMSPFLYKDGKFSAIVTNINSRRSPIANLINNKGQIVLSAYNPDGLTEAFLWQNNKAVDIGQLRPEAINDNGDIAGEAGFGKADPLTQTYNVHAFIFTPGKKLDLGTLGGIQSIAYGINNKGEVVGESDIRGPQADVRHAFIYRNGKMDDLNKLAAKKADWTLESGADINDIGQIVCNGIRNRDGLKHAFLLTPAGK